MIALVGFSPMDENKPYKIRPMRSTSVRGNLNAPKLNRISQARFSKYCKVMKMNSREATTQLLRMHKNGANIAAHMSAMIGADHQKYKMKLSRLGVHSSMIR